MLAERQKEGVDVQEYRTNFRGNHVEVAGLQRGFMITSGFAPADLVFHPTFRSDADFRYVGRQEMNGRPAFVIAFAQKPRIARIFERINSGSVSVLILVQGLAWIDSEINHILRLRTDLLKPAGEIRRNANFVLVFVPGRRADPSAAELLYWSRETRRREWLCDARISLHRRLRTMCEFSIKLN